MKILILAFCLHWAMSTAQPQCSKDFFCPDGQFCLRHLGTCAPCVNCSGYNRLPDGVPDDGGCARGVTDCGECLDGYEIRSDPLLCVDKNSPLVDDRSASTKGHSIPVDQHSPSANDKDASALPAYVWCLIVLAVVLFIVVTVIVVYVVNPRLKTAALGYSPGEVDAELAPPSLPPPPYNPDVPPPTSPPPYDPPGTQHYKRDPYDFNYGNGGRGDVENQRAMPFSPPHYVRPPPSHTDDLNDVPSVPEPGDDDNTRESIWTPSPAQQNGSSRSLSEQLSEARGRTGNRAPLELEPDTPPAKMSRQDSNQPEGTDNRNSVLIAELDGPTGSPSTALDLNGNTQGSNGLILPYTINTHPSNLISPYNGNTNTPSTQYGRADIRNIGASNDIPNGNTSPGDGASPPSSPPSHRASNNNNQANITINNFINVKQHLR